MKPLSTLLSVGWLICAFAVSTDALAQTFPSSNPQFGRSLASSGQDKSHTVLTVEISSDSLESPGTQQRWMRMLQDVGADRVVSRTRLEGTAAVEETSTSGVRLIRVQGFLAGGRLTLPGGKFRINEVGKIRSLLQKFRDDGKDTTLAEKFDFGLTASQLVSLAKKFEVPVETSTKDKSISQVTGEIAKLTGIPFTRDRSAQVSLASDEVVSQEFQGMSAGTALAAIVKSRGLVMEPSRKQGQDVVVEIKSAQDSKDSWPVGRQPKQAPVSIAPKLFQKLPIGIKNFPLDKVLAAFQKKAEMPILFDEATIASKGIDIRQTKVSISHKDGVLITMIGRLLRQSRPKMSYELRTDDAGHPFIWITVR